MQDYSSPGLIDILRSVLARLDEDAPGGANDPAVIEFKRRILRSIAELNLQRKSLQPPDVLLPESGPLASAKLPPPPSAGSGPVPLAADAPVSPDSVVLLVARRSPKTPDDGGGESSAA